MIIEINKINQNYVIDKVNNIHVIILILGIIKIIQLIAYKNKTT